MMFDELSSKRLLYYVYALIDPRNERPFYIGKGVGNRVFNHLERAIKGDNSSLKLDTIRDVISEGYEVRHVIIRHGLTEKEAFEVEASLLDFGQRFGFDLSNIVEGHHSSKRGLMTADDIIRRYNAEPLVELLDPIIININKRYTRGQTKDDIYNATKEAWVVSKSRRETVQYALAEYEGIIIAVFRISDWYPIITPDYKRSNRWGFNGEIANEEVRSRYLNKSIMHAKKQGAANPVRYRI